MDPSTQSLPPDNSSSHTIEVREADSQSPVVSPPIAKSGLATNPTTAHKASIHLKRKAGASTRPKQSKSRDGCLTCKKKRLKCDEAKPLCIQCQKRGVDCEGYKKDLKWKSFKEIDFVENGGIAGNQQKGKAKRRNTISMPSAQPDIVDSPTGSLEVIVEHSGIEADQQPHSNTSILDDLLRDKTYSPPSTDCPIESLPGQLPLPIRFDKSHSLPDIVNKPRLEIEPVTITSSLESMFVDIDDVSARVTDDALQGLSPSFLGMLMTDGDMISSMIEPFSMLDDFDIQQHIMPDLELEDSASGQHIESPSANKGFTLQRRHTSPVANMYSPKQAFDEIHLPLDDPNMLITRFMHQTCGILSVKDGPTENPWRTIIWPLAKGNPSLYHAVASMAAFHGSHDKPHFRTKGLEHLKESVRLLQSEIRTIDRETALATTIVLAFAVSWNKDIATGINFLHGARILMYKALARHKQKPRRGMELARLKFLCNTWVYIDVISRITAVDDDISTDFDQCLSEFYEPLDTQFSEIDPLMGCASNLFPLVGRVANLCRKVCTTATNSVALISEANELKEHIQAWRVSPHFQTPQDTTSHVTHAIQTAEAYRYATLLYLHQAVPELPSLTTAQLAEKVLMKLATVPPSSRLLIVHIYPLFVAGCEASSVEDRNWVEARWHHMRQRMRIGNVDSCWLVTKEVWARKDAFTQLHPCPEPHNSDAPHNSHHIKFAPAQTKLTHSLSDSLSSPPDYPSYADLLPDIRQVKYRKPRYRAGQVRKREVEVLEDMDPEFTVRGRLHWVDVLMDWNWEVLLG